MKTLVLCFFFLSVVYLFVDLDEIVLHLKRSRIRRARDSVETTAARAGRKRRVLPILGHCFIRRLGSAVCLQEPSAG